MAGGVDGTASNVPEDLHDHIWSNTDLIKTPSNCHFATFQNSNSSAELMVSNTSCKRLTYFRNPLLLEVRHKAGLLGPFLAESIRLSLGNLHSLLLSEFLPMWGSMPHELQQVCEYGFNVLLGHLMVMQHILGTSQHVVKFRIFLQL